MRKIEIESHLPADECVFLDRAVPDSIAYFRFEGLDSSEPEQLSRLVRYCRVFFFDRLQFTRDAVRSENEGSANTLEGLIEVSYRQLGYDLIRVPVMPVAERTRWVLAYR